MNDSVHIRSVMTELHNLMQESKFCDTLIKIEGDKYPCHKCVLAAASPVFFALFTEKVDQMYWENDQLVLHLTNISSFAFKHFLEFLYTGKDKETELIEYTYVKQIFFSNNFSLDKFCDMFIENRAETHDAPNSSLVCVEISLADMKNEEKMVQSSSSNSKPIVSTRYTSKASTTPEKAPTKKSGRWKLPVDPPFVCPDASCDKVYPTRERLRSHVRHVHSERRFSCQRCHSKFVYRKDLIIHTRIHTGEKPYICNICSKSFAQVGTYNTHKRVHEKEMNAEYPCGACGKIYKIRKDLLLHIRYDHPKHPIIYSSTNDSEISSNNLSVATVMKEGQSSNLESLDDATVTLFQEITESMKSNVAEDEPVDITMTTEKATIFENEDEKKKRRSFRKSDQFQLPWSPPFLCPVEHCAQVYDTRVKLRSHIRSSHREKNFLCTECPARFLYENELIVHMRIHTGEKPFLCDHCGKSYGQKSSLNAHRRKKGLPPVVDIHGVNT